MRPYRLMDPKNLPPKLRTVLKRSWRPIFQLMEEAPQVSIPRDPSSLDAPKIKQLYDGGTQHLKSKVSYIWPDGGDENEEHNTRREKWSVATWSSKISRSQVVKHGSQANQSHLAAATRHNELHSHRPRKKRKVTRQGFQNQHDEEEVDKALRGMIRGLGAATRERAEIDIREVRREAAARGGGLGAASTQERAARGRGASTSTNADTRRQVAHTEEDEDAFENAFRDVRLVKNDTMTPRQAQWDQEFKEEADKEIEDGRQAAASHRQAVGDGVATDGSVLFVRHSTGLRRNYGDNQATPTLDANYIVRFWISQHRSSQHRSSQHGSSQHKRSQHERSQHHQQQRRSHHRRQSSLHQQQLVPSKGALWVTLL